MSYHAIRVRQALGTSLIKDLLGGANDILSDPALPEVTKLILKLNDLQQAAPVKVTVKTPAKPGAKPVAKPVVKQIVKPAAKVPGIGLSNIVLPLKAYVYTQEHSWVIPVAIGAVLAIPFLIGYKVGKRRKGR